jgi:hypothetical protein
MFNHLSDILEKFKRTETLFALYSLIVPSIFCWYGKIDGTALVASITLVSTTYGFGRSYLKSKGFNT